MAVKQFKPEGQGEQGWHISPTRAQAKQDLANYLAMQWSSALHKELSKPTMMAQTGTGAQSGLSGRGPYDSPQGSLTSSPQESTLTPGRRLRASRDACSNICRIEELRADGWHTIAKWDGVVEYGLTKAFNQSRS